MHCTQCKAEAYVTIIKDCSRGITLLKLTTAGQKASRGFSATTELLVSNNFQKRPADPLPHSLHFQPLEGWFPCGYTVTFQASESDAITSHSFRRNSPARSHHLPTVQLERAGANKIVATIVAGIRYDVGRSAKQVEPWLMPRRRDRPDHPHRR